MNLGKESEMLEFKKTTGELKEAMVSISAILNKHGVGTLYFGVKPNGDVTGQDVSESSLRDVSRLVYESIKPQIYPVIQEEILDGRHVIKVEFNGEDYPYSALGRYYLRTADEDREVTPAELRQFFVVTLKAALFATDEKLTFLDMQMYEDNILNLLKTAETYILKNINWRSEIVGIDREEVPEIPIAAIREILANSYAHAVYNSNTYHEICIYPNRVAIYSPGSFLSE